MSDKDHQAHQPPSTPAATPAGAAAAPATTLAHTPTYFFYAKDDLVWIHPKKGYPLWPAEVQDMGPKTHVVTCKLICPPEESLAKPLTAHASKLFYFDKYSSQQQMDADIERRLQRDRFNVAAFEQTYRTAVKIATRLASCPMTANAVREDSKFCVAPIGVVHSPFRSHCDAPRQPSTGATALEGRGGVIRVAPELAQGLQDLKGFERIWVLFHFSFSQVESGNGAEEKNETTNHSSTCGAAAAAASSSENQNDHVGGNAATAAADRTVSSSLSSSSSSGLFYQRPDRHEPSDAFKMLIVPPRETRQRGVFATRAPHRPNLIGLSCVRLLEVKGCDVHITDHDLLHGTPVLDIKPYLPYCDAHPNARFGWVDALNRSGAAKGDHRPAGSTDYTVTRARGLTLDELTASAAAVARGNGSGTQ